MFCGSEKPDENGTLTVFFPQVRQCLQGGSQTKLSWWDGLWKDDTWSPECSVRYCVDEPPANTMVKYIPDPENFCWNWEPATDEETGSIPTEDGEIITPSDPYSVLIYRLTQEIQAIEKKCGKM